MSKSPGSRLTLSSGILACLVLSLSIQTMAAPPELISDSGLALSSVFQGLKPNLRLANYKPLGRPWRGVLRSRLPGLLNANIVYGSDFCPVSSCAGNYTNFQPNPGGCVISTGCDNVQDFYTDFNEPCTSGEMDSECGDGSGACCANAQPCDNYDGCQ